jgi:signal recognition particle subunit SRP54
MFDSLTKNFSGIIDKIRGKKFISEDDLNEALREIRRALLEADVALTVTKDFIEKIRKEAIGQQVIKNVESGQMIVKIVNDKLLELLGKDSSELDLTKQPLIILMLGLQGSGKTTTSAKLALKLKDKYKKEVLLVSLDTYRPAAQDQLELLGKKTDINTLEIIDDQTPLQVAKRAIKESAAYDVIIFDTAGRLHIDEKMMKELIDIKEITKPAETLLVADSLTGQDAANIAKEFNEKIGLTGIILTKVDGDGRGGSALSIKMVSNRPIKYIGIGEKLTDFEEFHPDRIASRILDMGDIVSFVEKTQKVIDEQEAQKLEKKLKEGNFDLNDLANQLKNLKRLGGIGSMLSFLPGAGKIKDFLKQKEFDEKEIYKQESIIMSMTPAERRNPEILNSSRKFRIVRGSGSTIQEVNSLLKKFKQMKKTMDVVGKMDKNQIKDIMRQMETFKE